MSTPRKRLIVGIIVSAVVVLLAGGTWVSSLDSTCGSCHTAQAAAAAKSAHASTSCYSCHLDSPWDFVSQKGTEVFRMYPRAIGGVKLDGPGSRVSRSACASCHDEGPAGVMEANGLRIRHDQCAASPTLCDSCHGSTAHGKAVRWQRTVVMDECVACHRRANAPVKCDTCHRGKREGERITSGPWQVTHGPQWEKTHGMGDLDSCSACHEPSKCVTCHHIEIPHRSDIYNSHGALAAREDARCTMCHTNKSWCTSCHGIEMPHPKGFIKKHSKAARNYKDSKCLACHATEDCVNCHEAHTHPGMTEGSLSGGGR